jgi:ribose transport system ATP-binding protein
MNNNTEKELLLRTHGIGKTYGTNTVLKDIDMEIFRGEVVGLIGENGAGKSTLLKIVSGVEKPSAGTMEMNNKPYICNSLLDANHQGVGMVFQEQSLIGNLSVAQNIYLGREHLFAKNGIVNWNKMNIEAKNVLAQMQVEHISPKVKIQKISFALRQMVEIAKVLDLVTQATKNRSIIMLDEPTTVLSDDEIKILFEQVRRLKEAGNAVIFVSHRLQEVLDISDRIYVFRDGINTATLDTSEVDEYILYEKMVDRETSGEYFVTNRQTVPKDDTVLTVNGLGRLGEFKDVSFELKKGEILGFCGLEGSGKEALCNVLCGDDEPTFGKITYMGKTCLFKTPKDALMAGIISIPKDRRDEGIIGILSIEDNISLSSLDSLSKYGFISSQKLQSNANLWVKKLGIKCVSIKERISQLSGGNAQKVIFARALSKACDLVILNHPTRGVDIGAKEDIYKIIRDIAEKGTSIILLGDTLDECIGISSRILVMKDGVLNGEFDCSVGNKPSQVDILQRML